MYPRDPHPSVSVVMCTLNEEKNLPHVLPRIPTWVDEIIIVDGHSSDNTVEVARKLRPSVRILYQTGRGKGDALKQGFAASSGDIVVTLDADGTYFPEEIERFVRAIIKGYDFAKGSRFLEAQHVCMPLRRKLGNKILVWTANLLFHTNYTDICSGYYAFRRTSIAGLGLTSDGFEMEQELFVKAAQKLRVVEVGHSYGRRTYGVSKTRELRQGIKDLAWIVLLRVRGLCSEQMQEST